MRTSMALLSGALLLGVPCLAAADSYEKKTEETTTTYRGRVTEIDPSSSTFILQSESASAPTKYTFTKKTTFVDAAGNVVTLESIRNSPVTIYSTREGDSTVVSKVVVTKPMGGVIEKREQTEERRTID